MIKLIIVSGGVLIVTVIHKEGWIAIPALAAIAIAINAWKKRENPHSNSKNQE